MIILKGCYAKAVNKGEIECKDCELRNDCVGYQKLLAALINERAEELLEIEGGEDKRR